MSVFDRYARYYDLLYRDKDYGREARFVQAVLSRHGLQRGAVLDLGCGTGRHACALGELGYTVLGIDLSQHMIDEAESRRNESAGVPLSERVTFAHGDIRSLRRSERFDAVVSLFHVVSYQVSNDDLLATFASARRHLPAGGVFVFDCWYGPAVLAEGADVRVKRMEDAESRVLRVAEPHHFPNDNRVDVHYEVLVADKAGGGFERFEEIHSMRFLFLPELELLLRVSGFELLTGAEWLTDRPLDETSWNAYFVARATERDSGA